MRDMYKRVCDNLQKRYDHYLYLQEQDNNRLAAQIPMGILTRRFYEYGAAETAYRRVVVLGAVVSILGRSWFNWDWRMMALVGALTGLAWAYNGLQRRFALALGKARYSMEMAAQEAEMRAVELAKRNDAILNRAHRGVLN